jgi:hypothetical protein
MSARPPPSPSLAWHEAVSGAADHSCAPAHTDTWPFAHADAYTRSAAQANAAADTYANWS